MDKLPKGWSLKPINSVFKIRSGSFLPKSEIVEGDFDVYGGNGITGKHSSYNLEGENIIIGRVGAKCGNVRLINDKIWLTDNAFYISEYLVKVNLSYLSLFLEYVDLGKTANQAAQPVISFKGIKDISIPLPPLSDQTRIVAKLDALFERIDKSIALLEENIKHTQALMASVLEEVFRELDVNKQYEKKALKEVVRVINGRAYKQDELLEKGKYPVLRVGNFFTNRSWYYSDLELDNDKYCNSGDLLYAWSASFGPKIWDGERAIFHYHIWKMEPMNDNILKEYLFFLLQRDTDKIKEEGGRGVGMIHITKGDIEKRLLTVPSFEIQEKTVNRITSVQGQLNKLMKQQQSKLTHLKALKASLLDRAFKGEL